MDKRSSYHDTEKKIPFQANDSLPKCSKHKDEVLKYYCRAHDKVGCVDCMMSHSYCEKDYIPDISAHYASLDEYLNLEVTMRSLRGRISESKKKMKENSRRSENEYQIAIDGILARKVQLLEYINELEQQLKEKAMTYKKANEEAMGVVKFDLNELENKLMNADTLLNKYKRENKPNMLLLHAKDTGKELVNYCERMYEISKRNHVNGIEYLPKTEKIEEHTFFGKIIEKESKRVLCNSQETTESKEVSQVNIMSETDKKTCYATGLTFLSDHYLAIADKANKNVKLVDVSHDQIVSQIELTSSPRDITVIPSDKLAVTLRDEERIQLLSTRKGLTKTEQIKTAGKCRGIKYDDEKLIVAFDNIIRPKIEILTLNGEVLRTFQLNEEGSMLFSEPKCIGLSPDSNWVYVSDVGNMNVFRLSMFGNETVMTGRHKYMGLVVSAGGSVYTCSKSANAVYMLSDDLSYDETVLTTNDGIKAPIGLVISNTRRMLYVSCGSNEADVANKLHVFKIKPKVDDNSTTN